MAVQTLFNSLPASIPVASLVVLFLAIHYYSWYRYKKVETKRKTPDHLAKSKGDRLGSRHISSKQAGKYQMTMGLRKSTLEDWLYVDDNYTKEHEVKRALMESRRDKIIRCLPGSKGACEETLELVVGFLLSKYPERFNYSTNTIRGGCVRIVDTGETFRLSKDTSSDGFPSLETASRLAMEDFNILTKSSEGQHILQASATCFPVGWSVEERIGWPIQKLHGKVPLWQHKLHHPVEHFLSRIPRAMIMERSTYFVQVTQSHEGIADILCQLQPLEYKAKPTNPEQILIRRERQVFRRLMRSKAVLFTVKTSIEPLTQVSMTELRSFVREAQGWPDDVARYRGRDCWAECVSRYYDTMMANGDEDTISDTTSEE